MEGRKRSSIFMAVALLLCHVANGRPLVSNTRRVVRTIEGEVGDVIDCVDIYSQPAFDHPLLKDHKLKVLFLDKHIKATYQYNKS
ncbi:hypothetical protein EJ110_NYTH16877 [Nymphaea thermarum]|nr:hypothetical protein EJ110_NYTH16877 [Nymphaea thermarum]